MFLISSPTISRLFNVRTSVLASVLVCFIVAYLAFIPKSCLSEEPEAWSLAQKNTNGPLRNTQADYPPGHYPLESYSGSEGEAINQGVAVPKVIRTDQLRTGMSYHDIVRLFGAPDDRTEFETRRQDRWKYGEVEIFFSSGKVVAWSGRSHEVNDAPAYPTARSPVNEAAVEEILAEIMSTPVSDPAGK